MEACTDGAFDGAEPSELTPEELAQILGDDMTPTERDALVRLSEVRGQEDPEADALREALWDIDEFAESR